MRAHQGREAFTLLLTSVLTTGLEGGQGKQALLRKPALQGWPHVKGPDGG